MNPGPRSLSQAEFRVSCGKVIAVRKSVVVLGIVLILGIAAMPAASAVTQTQRFVSILRASGFETELPEGGRWVASYPYKDICAIARIEFPNTPWESSKGRGLERLGRTGLLACQKHTTPGWGYVAEPQQSSFRPSARPRIYLRIYSWVYSWAYPRVHPRTRCDSNLSDPKSGPKEDYLDQTGLLAAYGIRCRRLMNHPRQAILRTAVTT